MKKENYKKPDMYNIMMKKLMLVFVLMIALIGITSASDLQYLTVKQGDVAILTQNCVNSTYSNISRITYPNGTFLLNGEYSMTKSGNDYNYSLNDTATTGEYNIYGHCDLNGIDTSWVYKLYDTPNGALVNIQTAILMGLIFITLIGCLIFVLNKVFTADSLHWKVGYSTIVYLLFVATSFIAWSIANNYLYDIPFIASILYYVWLILIILAFPVFIFAFLILLKAQADELMIKNKQKYGYSREEAESKFRRK